MSELIIRTHDEKAKKLLIKLAKELNAEVEEVSQKNGQRIVNLMNELATQGGLTSIKDPVAWQREIRKDRKLPFRS